jgi:Spy/CpxP family protein refolding chaperone
MRTLIALPILAALSFAAAASAGPAPGTIMKVTPPGPEKNIDRATLMCRENYKLQLANLGQLAHSLNLTPAQQPKFEAWRTSRLDLWKATPCPPLPLGLEIPAPQRIKNQITMATATLEGLRKELPAAEALYSVLTPEQRAIFDGPIKLAAPPPAAPPPAPAPSH